MSQDRSSTAERRSTCGADFAYLVDFGVARSLDDAEGDLTVETSVIGSVAYMAPERFGPAIPDRHSDVYSLACLLYETLTGRRPFVESTYAASAAAHRHGERPRPSAVRGGLPPALDEVVARGVSVRPDDLYPTAGQLARAALAAMTTTVSAGDTARDSVSDLEFDWRRAAESAGVEGAAPVSPAPTLPAPSPGPSEVAHRE